MCLHRKNTLQFNDSENDIAENNNEGESCGANDVSTCDQITEQNIYSWIATISCMLYVLCTYSKQRCTWYTIRNENGRAKEENSHKCTETDDFEQKMLMMNEKKQMKVKVNIKALKRHRHQKLCWLLALGYAFCFCQVVCCPLFVLFSFFSTKEKPYLQPLIKTISHHFPAAQCVHVSVYVCVFVPNNNCQWAKKKWTKLCKLCATRCWLCVHKWVHRLAFIYRTCSLCLMYVKTINKWFSFFQYFDFL